MEIELREICRLHGFSVPPSRLQVLFLVSLLPLLRLSLLRLYLLLSLSDDKLDVIGGVQRHVVT